MIKDQKISTPAIVDSSQQQIMEKIVQELSDNLRHDWLTPISGMIGCAEILSTANFNAEIQDHINSLLVSGYQLRDFCNDILHKVRLRIQKTVVKQRKFSLTKQLQTILALNHAVTTQKKLILTVNIDKKIPLYLVGDDQRIYFILLELVNNALKFTHHGQIELTAQVAKKTKRHLLLKLSIKDTGIGIAPDKQADIFIPFTRLTPAYQGLYSGTGLGLAIVREYLYDLDGEIALTSEVGQGTQFTLFIPCKRALLEHQEKQKTAEYAQHSSSASELNQLKNRAAMPTELVMNGPSDYSANRVLLVEDHPIAVRVMQHMLSMLHCHIDVATNGASALQLVQQHYYDIIFLDIGLPDMPGQHVARAMMQQYMVPIIALTAHASEDMERDCLLAGMRLVLVKPLTYAIARHLFNIFITHRVKTEPICVKDAVVFYRASGLEYQSTVSWVCH